MLSPTPSVSTMTTSNQVVIDTSVLVALVDRRDKWHTSADALRKIFRRKGAGLIYFDPVINETFSVLARRAQEQGRSQEFSGLLKSLTRLVPKEVITWISPETQRLFEDVVALMRGTSGELNFHDALIALACRLFGINVIASFDRDFDRVEWLTRVETPDAAVAAFEQVDSPQIS
jgi:predicted nucleic acid-binding protein